MHPTIYWAPLQPCRDVPLPSLPDRVRPNHTHTRKARYMTSAVLGAVAALGLLLGSHWNGSHWNGSHWNVAPAQGSHWNGSHWNGSHWNGSHWNRVPAGSHWNLVPATAK